MDVLENDAPLALNPELKKIIPYFLKSRQSDLVKLAAAIQAKECGAIWLIGHNMKGSSASYGFPFLGQLGQRLEQLAESRDFATIEQVLAQLKSYLNRVEEVLK